MFAIFSCKKDEFSFDDLSRHIDIDYGLAAPLIVGSFSLSDLTDAQDDSILVINGDTVKLYIRSDSILNLGVDDFLNIPEQDVVPYYISPEADIDVSLMPDNFIITELIKDTAYTVDLENGVRLDSVVLNEAYITLYADNTFRHSADLIISSDNIKDAFGNSLNETVFVGSGSVTNEQIDISGRKVIFDRDANWNTQIALNFTPVFYKNPSFNTVDADNSISLEFGFDGLNDFQALFGFVGFLDTGYDTTLSFEIENLYNLTGSFNATNPKLILEYDHSVGIKLDADFLFNAFHSDGPDVIIDPPNTTLVYSDDYLNPYSEGTIEYTNATVTNLDELIAFPVPDSVGLTAAVLTNVGLDSTTAQNFVNDDSEFNLSFEIELPLEFSADLTYKDTVSLPGFEDIEELVYIDYANLHYWFTNEFPLGFDIKVYLYDSASVEVVDTIFLNDVGEFFLTPAPVDEDGVVIQEQVQELHGVANLDSDQTDNLIRNASHMIIEAKIQTYEVASVKILSYYELLFQFGLEMKGRYEGELE